MKEMLYKQLKFVLISGKEEEKAFQNRLCRVLRIGFWFEYFVTVPYVLPETLIIRPVYDDDIILIITGNQSETRPALYLIYITGDRY